MAEQTYNNYRLRRTLTKLSGNMKLDLIVNKKTASTLCVNQAHLRPVASITPYVPIIDERIMDRPHKLNIKKYYERMVDSFYEYRSIPELMSDWYWTISATQVPELKYVKTWSDEYWAGTQRMSYKLYGTTHEILVPVWLEAAQGIKFKIDVLPNIDNISAAIASYTLDLTTKNGSKFHNDFVDYINEYLQDSKISQNNNNVLQINYKTNHSVISGIHAPSGNYVTRNDYNVARNLIFRARPLLEANSLITNMFHDYRMICSQLINFNICFDVNELISGSMASSMIGLPSCRIICNVEVLRDGEWEELETRDFYTNHYYVPRETYYENSTTNIRTYDDNYQWRNALDYLMDYNCTEMMHQNKVVQPICHWVMTDQPDGQLFNVYNGFGAVIVDENNEEHFHDHGFGLSPDPNDTEYDRSLDNTNWAGMPMIGDGNDVEEVLNDPQHYIDTGNLVPLSNYVNGLQFNYEMDPDDPTSPEDVYICTMTTPWDSNYEDWITAHTQLMSNQQYIGILTQRINAYGRNDLPKDREHQKAESFDQKYDWFKHADIDNRWARYVNGSTVYNGSSQNWSLMLGSTPVGTNGYNIYLREYDNVTALYVCMRRMVRYTETGELDPHAPLICVFWHARMQENITAQHENQTLLPHGLTLGGVLDALRDYNSNYGDLYEEILDNGGNTSGLPNMDDFGYVTDAMLSLVVPDVIYFNRSVFARADITLSQHASEINYFKNNEANDYVWRYSAKIRPAIFPEKTQRYGDLLTYLATYGRNFLWEKQLLFPASVSAETEYKFPSDVLKYINTNVPPRYPSLGYDSVIPSVRYGQNGEFMRGNNGVLPCKYGDLLYDEPHPKYFGKDMFGVDLKENEIYALNNNRYDTYEWFEYKWFDKSTVIKLPHSFVFNIETRTNEKSELETAVLNQIQSMIGKFNDKLLDLTYLKKTYKIDYVLQDVKYEENLLYTYTYKIKAELK